MNYWKKVDIEHYQIFINKLVSLDKNEKIFYGLNHFWHPLKEDKYDLIRQTISEFANIENKFGEVNEIAMLVLTSDISNLHVDHDTGRNNGVLARLNLPIVNCKGSYTSFYELDEDTYMTHHANSGGTKTWSSNLRNSLRPITSVELVQPTILRTSTPHTVFCHNCSFPRVSLTISFKDDIVKYLDQ
jgi:hypothetical protein